MNEAGSDFAICHLNEAEEEGEKVGESGHGVHSHSASRLSASVRPFVR